MTPALVAVVVCAAGLVAWRWYLTHRRWELERADKVRDEVLAALGPRLAELEGRVNAAEMGKAFKR